MFKLEFDSEGIAEMLRSPGVRHATRRAGNAVAARVRGETAGGERIPVEVWERTARGVGRSGWVLSDRLAVNITFAHAAGLAVEAKRGPLMRAAADVGLQVKARPQK